MHIGIIMDGHRRWAKRNGLTTEEGHIQGQRHFKDVLKWCLEYRVSFLTAFVFSVDNLKRNQVEIRNVANLITSFFVVEENFCVHNKIKFNVIGNGSMISPETWSVIKRVNTILSKDNNLCVQLGIEYGGREELLRAFIMMARDIEKGRLNIESISENVISAYLYTAELPDIDLIIRTGDTHRLSNFSLWQSIYSEIYFSKKMFPDFTKEDFIDALTFYTLHKKAIHGV